MFTCESKGIQMYLSFKWIKIKEVTDAKERSIVVETTDIRRNI